MLTYTRYLYSFEDVKLSYVISLLNKDLRQCYFWIYEMYYSGFQNECFNLNLILYKEVYVYRKQIYEKMIEQKKLWELYNDPIYLANIVKNMVNQNISISRFVKNFCKYNKVKDEKKKITLKFLYASKEEIKEYDTVQTISSNCNFNILKYLIKYKVRREFDDIFKREINSLDELRDNWLYNAYNSPIWKERIEEYNGYVNVDKKRIDFDNVDNEDAFHDKYNYEPDEQPLELQKSIVGEEHGNKLDIYYLCKFYGGILSY